MLQKKRICCVDCPGFKLIKVRKDIEIEFVVLIIRYHNNLSFTCRCIVLERIQIPSFEVFPGELFFHGPRNDKPTTGFELLRL
jgi:hypothetical protein